MIAPFVYNPSWSPRELWEAGKAYIKEAAKTYHARSFTIINATPPGARKYGTGGRLYGLWMDNRIWVNVAASTRPARVRGRVWSFPGHKTDRTSVGILAHEFAHHLYHNTSIDRARWKTIVAATRPVTSYEPIAEEAWAETMRIYIMNPHLLQLARPERWTFIYHYFKPLHAVPWFDVLINAPEFIKHSASNFAHEKEILRNRRCQTLL